MTFEQILELLNDTTKTRYQLAANIHALISKATTPSAFKVQPIKERKARGPNKAKATSVVVDQPIMNGHDHEAHS